MGTAKPGGVCLPGLPGSKWIRFGGKAADVGLGTDVSPLLHYYHHCIVAFGLREVREEGAIYTVRRRLRERQARNFREDIHSHTSRVSKAHQGALTLARGLTNLPVRTRHARFID